MGLFDSYYDPQSAPTSGGLLARLLVLIWPESADGPFGPAVRSSAVRPTDARRCD
jgi:hypothetical protein